MRDCFPKGDGISTTKNLLDKYFLRVYVWIIAIFTCIGNIAVMSLRVLLKEEYTIHSIFIKNLSGKFENIKTINLMFHFEHFHM